MNLLDVNFLIALYRPKHVHHVRARRWWRECLAGGEAVTVPDLVWLGFLRLMTNPRVVSVPASYAEAWDFAQQVMAESIYLRHVVDGRVMAECTRIALEARASGNLVTDAYIAACAVTLGATVVSFDRDFRKFDGVRVLEPA